MDQSRLLNLPQELRDMVYEHMRTVFDAAIGTGRQPTLRVELLVVSKQVYAEYRAFERRIRRALPQDGKLRYRD